MNRIRDLRIARGWRQVDLADKLHIKKNTVSRYETGSLGVDATTICDLCDLFGCTADYLLGRSDSLLPAVSDEDAQLLAAYHAAPDHVRAAIDTLLLPVAPVKKEVS